MEKHIHILVDDGRERKEIDFDIETTIEEIVRAIGRLPDSYIALVSGVPVPMTEIPEPGSVIRLIRVASGG